MSVKIGICGFGKLGRTHFSSMQKIDSVQVAAICDINPEQFKELENSFHLSDESGQADITKCKTYTSIQDMLKSEQLDGVVIATPTDTHAELSIYAMDAGCSVLCEKPMALTPDDCERMIEARDRNGVQLMIAQCIRFWPEYKYLLECIKDKRFGQLKSLYMERIGYYPTDDRSWFKDSKRSGGALLDLHVHDVDWAQTAFGEPSRLFAAGSIGISGGVDDVAALWTYDNGPVVTIRGSWNCCSGFNMGFQAFFEEATINFSSKSSLSVTGTEGKDDITPSLSTDNGYLAEAKYFVDCVSGRIANIKCPAESSKASIEIANKEINMIYNNRIKIGG